MKKLFPNRACDFHRTRLSKNYVYLNLITIKDDKKNNTKHKILSNPEFLIVAYNNLKKNKSLKTSRLNSLILDNIDFENFKILGKEIHTGTYNPKPKKKVYINKQHSLPNALDIILQEAVRIILEYIYEPKFLTTSHGFRPKKGCHTALNFYKKKFQKVS